MATPAHQTQPNHGAPTRWLYMAFDLGNTSWHLAFGDGTRHRVVTIAARDLPALEAQIREAKRAFKLDKNLPIRSCYEAGRDGFWLHRHLEQQAIDNTVVDPASVETTRRARRAKTDRIDAKKLLRKLIQYHGGDRDVWSALHIPTRDQEHERRLMRHRKQLQKEINAHTSRIRSLTLLHGIHLERISKAAVADAIHLLGPLEQQEVLFAQQRMELAREQLSMLEAEQKRRLEASRPAVSSQPARQPQAPQMKAQPQVKPHAQLSTGSAYAHQVARKVEHLTMLKGIGTTAAWRLVTEFFWRDFHNRRQVGAAAGLTATPRNSGDDEREQGISKTGSSAIRDMMVELSWLWTRWQPHSKLSLWFDARWTIGKRRRKTGIVAVARKLLIALWRYLEFGAVPEGAILNKLEAR